MHLKQLNVTLCLYFVFNFSVHAQQDAGHRFGLEVQYGFIIPHASDLEAVSQSNPAGLNLSYSRVELGKKNWDSCNCFHYLGLNLSYHSFNNPEVLGSATTLSGTFEPILWKTNGLQLSLRSGFGVSYLSKVYDKETNPGNTFFSSPVSFLILISPRFQLRLQENLSLNVSIHYNHISNGGQRQPNRGMNYPTLGLGINYTPQPFLFPSYSAKKTAKNRHYYLEAFGTLKGNPQGKGRLPLVGLSLGFHQRISTIQGIGLGMESQWDRSLTVSAGDFSGFIHAPYIAHHFLFGKVDFSQRMGIYVNKPKNYEPDKSFYQRYTLSYLLKNSLKVGVGLKAHGHVAENIEVRLGYQF